MNNIFFTAAIISFIFLLIKFLEMRFFEKENKPFKLLIRDTLLVYFSVIVGFFLLEQLKPVLNNDTIISSPNVFTDNPDF
jgi:hypothetical protein